MDRSPPAHETLIQLAHLLSELGRYGTEEAFETISKLSPSVAKDLYLAIERFPAAVVDVVGDTVIAATRRLGIPMAENRVHEVLFDPRSFSEAAQQIEELAGVLSRHPRADEAMGRVLEVLDRRGVLGMNTVEDLVRFLVAIRMTSVVRHGPVAGSLQARDEIWTRQRTDAMARSLVERDDKWAVSAVDEALGQVPKP